MKKYFYPEYQRIWYLKNKDRIAKKFKSNYRKYSFREKRNMWRRRFLFIWKTKAFEILGSKCLHCGFSDQRALQIDHIKGLGFLENKHRNATHYRRVCASVDNKEKKYQLLCANCNWIKRIENKEYAYRSKRRNVYKICATN